MKLELRPRSNESRSAKPSRRRTPATRNQTASFCRRLASCRRGDAALSATGPTRLAARRRHRVFPTRPRRFQSPFDERTWTRLGFKRERRGPQGRVVSFRRRTRRCADDDTGGLASPRRVPSSRPLNGGRNSLENPSRDRSGVAGGSSQGVPRPRRSAPSVPRRSRPHRFDPCRGVPASTARNGQLRCFSLFALFTQTVQTSQFARYTDSIHPYQTCQ
jgi:hypothetical protein